MWYLFTSPIHHVITGSCSFHHVIPIFFPYSSRDSLFLFLFIMWYLVPSPIHHVIPCPCSGSSCDAISFSYSSRDSLFLFLFIMCHLFPSPIHHVIPCSCSFSSCDTYFLPLYITWFLVLVQVLNVIHTYFLLLFITWYIFLWRKTSQLASRPEPSPFCAHVSLMSG